MFFSLEWPKSLLAEGESAFYLLRGGEVIEKHFDYTKDHSILFREPLVEKKSYSVRFFFKYNGSISKKDVQIELPASYMTKEQ